MAGCCCIVTAPCRSPHGERGLKSTRDGLPSSTRWSLSSRRAWIEIMACTVRWHKTSSLSSRRAWIEIKKAPMATVHVQSLSSRRAWIEIGVLVGSVVVKPSLSSRRAWIEIGVPTLSNKPASVALLTESVD